ncbi:hypothetical protein BDZ94DRAFT_1319724 [Collybia nuda]|uniref:Serine/threonine-protein kinase TEL1 n=1 Tax=Collybia nuda TaxID=64659 RepID=A0A9P6CML6_9AGAR|nr:hypothetical protein BDZ94DRAFT_1319724 [Collybia nuda]
MSNLKTVLQNLKSDKIKERQEGLASIRTVFAQDKVVANFHVNREGEGDPRAWLPVFQALFQAVLNEKIAATKTTNKSAGSAATAQRRLADAASAVRWLTEKTSELMNKRVVKALFEHLLQTIVHKGEMLMPVALDYIKALRCLVSFTPHLEHMEDDTWVRIAEMGFNVILSDPIKSTFELHVGVESSARKIEPDDEDLYEDDPMGEGEGEDVLPSTTRKRPRSNSNATFFHKPPEKKGSSQRQSSISVSLEQIEFMSVISIILRSSSSPILAHNYRYLPTSILLRLERFLDMYPTDTSLVQDYVVTVSSILDHLSLNRTHDVARFARKSWNGLVALWGTKNKRIKEGLVAVLRILFPFVATDNEVYQVTPFDCAEGIGKLWHLLVGEAESRWGIESLSFDALRFEPIKRNFGFPENNPAFIAKTFRSGWNFDAGQALAWATLELQADCAGKLLQLSESMHISATPGSSRGEGKRVRLESPIASLLSSIQHQPVPNVRTYHLQILLFFIDRHWSVVHDSLQQEVVQTLFQCISYDDGNIQSWVLLCFAAIAHTGICNVAHSLNITPGEHLQPPFTSSVQPVQNILAWDSIWTNAIRRANVPTVCRAACHAAHILLLNYQLQMGNDNHIPLSSQRVLSEIEALGKDLDVQGPVYPYDSVCAFLSQCLKIAGQDMRLYRMQLEEKVVSWLVDCWKVMGMGRKRMSLHTVKDIVHLLESICGLAKRSDPLLRIPLPDSQIVGVLVEEANVRVIRDFLLNAQLPPFGQTVERNTGTSLAADRIQEHTKHDLQLAQPRGRERKLSTFLLRSIEGLAAEWEGTSGYPTAETARQSLDVAVIALLFESILVLNGTQPNRRLIQSACKMVGIVMSTLCDAHWTPAEKALVMLGLDPLLLSQKDVNSDEHLEVMLPPDIGTGIKSQSLKHLNTVDTNTGKLNEFRVTFLRVVWQHPDVQEAFTKVSETIRIILRGTLGDTIPVTPGIRTSDRDDKDGFGPIRTTAAQQTSEVRGDGRYYRSHIMEVCIAFLTIGPALQSTSGESTRDDKLIEIILNCAEDRPHDFFLVLPVFLDKVQRRILTIVPNSLDNLLGELGRLLALYAYARSQNLQMLTTNVLRSTLDFWVSKDFKVTDNDILDKVQGLCAWLSGALRNQKIKSWRVRDAFARFLDAYLVRDWRELTWAPPEEDETDNREKNWETFPTRLLPFMNSDEDIRIRFRVAVINARLFAVARKLQSSPMEMYDLIKEWYSVDVDNYEHILTRILSLGNIMVVSSAVRRGPYWHLIETCLYSPHYSRHIESVLRGVSERMGLTSFSVLFTSYASQLAFSIRKVESDILRFPPHLLGYSDRKECAKLTFRSFAAINIWHGGEKLFEGHCKILQKTVKSGLQECFGDIIGYQIMAWVNEHEFPSHQMEDLIQSKTSRGVEFEESLNRNIDGIITSILRTVSDQDFSDDGPIVAALLRADQTGKTSRIYHALVKYRRSEDFDCHKPNLPVFPIEAILRALMWLHARLPNVDTKATTYHILHQLFADIEQSPLVNEQLRLMNAISIWIAWRNEEFDDATLLHTLIHGATSLFEQSDLVRSSQSIIEWALDQYRTRKTKDSRFPDIVIRIACLSQDYACNTVDLEVAKMGNELCRWIDNEVLKVSKIVELKSQVLRALPAWPREPSTYLAKLYETITAESLSGILEDNRISSNKFGLVRRLADPVILEGYDEGKFTQSDFWRLKECIPPVDHLQEVDINAFVSLLLKNKGAIDSFGSDGQDSVTLLSKHRRSIDKRPNSPAEQIDKAQDFIVLTLLEMLQSDLASKVNIAYRTLRLISSASTDFAQGNLSPEHQIELEYLGACQPFQKARYSRNITELSVSEVFSESIKDYSRWISNITVLLSDILSEKYPFYAQLTDILTSDVIFGEAILPILVHTLLMVERTNTEPHATSYRTELSSYFSLVLSSSVTTIPCLRSIVGVVLHLRHSTFDSKDALCYNRWLNLDFSLLARSAISCGAYTTALLFLELAVEDRMSGTTRNTNNTSEERILYEIYRHIDEPDGFYGIDDSDLYQFLMKRFHHEKQWEKAFRFHGATLEVGGPHANDAEGLVNSFHSFGFNRLAMDALQRTSNTDHGPTSSPSTSYRLGWRTETWDLPDRNDEVPGIPLYRALRAVHRERDSCIVDDIIKHGLFQEMNRLRTLGPENVAEIRETVQDLMSIHEVAQWKSEPVQSHLRSRRLGAAYWKEFVDIDQGFEFSNLENIMATRISLIRSARQKEERQRIGTSTTPFAQNLIDVEQKCLVRLSEAARDANQIQIAINSVVRAQLLEKSPSFYILQEFASVLWAQKEEQMAVQYLSRLASSPEFTNVDESADAIQLAALLTRLGTWSSEACLKNPADINIQYFTQAVKLLETMDPTFQPDSNLSRALVYRECAIFAERQYQSIINSPDVIRWKMYVDRKRQEIQSREVEIQQATTKSGLEALAHNQNKAKKILEEDIKLFDRHNEARETFLKQAIEMYSQCLKTSDTFDVDGAIRLCSLWFANFDDDGLQDSVREALERVPSQKLVFLAHQLSARISTPEAGPPPKNQQSLQSLIVRMCKDHPFHSLYQVYCLKPEHPLGASSRRQSGRHNPLSTQHERAVAAGSIFDRLRTDPTSSERVRQVEQLSDACIEWAKYPIKDNAQYQNTRSKHFKIPTDKDLKITKISNLHVPIITQDTPLDPTMRYDNCAWIERYEKTFETAGGINLPKINLCYDTSGKKYKQLFKGEGNDDLRQDAVMEQVFQLVNSVLSRDRETRRRDLNIRCYKVVPLTSQAGVLEFVGNTSPLNGWLIRAHSRYRPEDLSYLDALKLMKDKQKKLKTTLEKDRTALIENFKFVKSKFKPVMRHYFTERHKTPISWFAMRLKYTRSVATTSIVGHVLGLGDRHMSNILLDNVTGQVVHIDLGIAFEQGKLLPIAETVPFRMTRDMVDGMGTSGTKGVFQRCSEETLRVLREDSEVIMTVLEVFKHDPLHSWTASDIKVRHAQKGVSANASHTTGRFGNGIGIDMSSGTAEEAADRALSSVARKLDKSLSVQYTVNQLVTDATHDDNLGLIFYGWSPHC